MRKIKMAASASASVGAGSNFSDTSPISLFLPPRRSEQKLLWLKTLRKHLSNHVIPVAIAQGLSATAESLQEAVLAASAVPGGANGACQPARRQPQTFPLESEIVTVQNLKKATKSFRGILQPELGSANEGVQFVVMVALLATNITGSRDFGLCIRDSTGEIPCEVVPPITCRNCVVLLKKWTLVTSASYGNYMEIEELVNLDRGCGSIQQLLEEVGGTFMTVADLLPLLNSEHMKELRDVNVVGRLTAISEPFRNGPDFMLIIRITDSSSYTSPCCHLMVQSPELLHLSRAMKLFAVYAFTHVKSAIMNKGREDEAIVLRATSRTAVECVPSDTVLTDLVSSWSSGLSSPLRKRQKREKDSVFGDDVTRLQADSHTRDASLLSYKGVITRCLLPEAGVYELDDRLTLYLTHSNLSNQGRGLRVGAEVEITNAHILKLSTPPYKKMSGFVCCPVSRVEVVRFSQGDTNFKAFVSQNILAQLLSRFAAMDVAWVTLVFLSLLKKFKKKREAFGGVRELCEMVGVARVHQDPPHSMFLRQPHTCPYLATVDLSLRPLLPTLQHLVELCKERVGSELFKWRGEKEAGAGGSVGLATAPVGVAVSATWAFGVVENADFPNPQVVVGKVSGNRVSGYMELCDETGSIPVAVCVPYSSTAARESDRDTETSWLAAGVREGSKIAIREFSMLVERTQESERAGDTKYSIYLHPHKYKVLNDEKSVVDQKQSVSKSERDGGKSLYVYIKSKNCLKQGENGGDPKSSFEALALAHTSLQELQSPGDTVSAPVTVVLGFTSARHYSYLNNHCVYRLSFSDDSQLRLPPLDVCLRESHVTVSDEMLVELVALPHGKAQADSKERVSSDRLLEIGELVSMFFLPKIQTTFASPQANPTPRSEHWLVSFRGVVLEHSYRIDCNTTPSPYHWQLPKGLSSSGTQNLRHVIALCIRGISCPNTAMVYCKYRSHESLPIGLLPGSIAAFHHFSVRTSTRSGNVYFVNSASSSITVESIDTSTEFESVDDPRGKSYGMTREMKELPVTYIYHLTQRLLQGCLSREVVSVKATVLAVQHAFIQYQCVSCQCTMVDRRCRPTCPSKKSTLNTDARLLIQDGTGEAHLYLRDRVIPVALGVTDTEWSDLLDLVYKVGQLSYNKSSFSKYENSSRPVTVREKAERMFVDVLTRPRLTRTIVAVCQPFLSPCEQSIDLGNKSYRVWAKRGVDYVTLSLPRLQLRLLAVARCDSLSHTHKLLTLLQTT